MSVRALGILLLKLWGLVTLVSGATAAVSLTFEAFLPMLRANDPLIRYALMNNGRGAAVSLLMGVALLFGAERIVSIVAPTETHDLGVVSSYTLPELQSLVFGGLGVYPRSVRCGRLQLSFTQLRANPHGIKREDSPVCSNHTKSSSRAPRFSCWWPSYC